MTPTRIDPFAGEGVQALSFYVHGWMYTPEIVVFQTSREARAWIDDQMRYWVRYSDRATALWYGYDPCVYNEPDDPESGILGTDGYPNYSATIDLDDIGSHHDITWEEA